MNSHRQSITYTNYRSSSLALLDLMNSRDLHVPQELTLGVKEDIQAGQTSNVARLAKYAREHHEIGPAQKSALYWCGRYLEAQGAVDAALSAYEDAYIIDRTNGTVARAYSMLLQGTGNRDRALSVLRDTRSAQEQDASTRAIEIAQVWDGFGLIYADIGELAESAQAFRSALSYVGRALNARELATAEAAMITNDAASIEIRQRNFPEAKRLLCRAIELEPQTENVVSLEIASSKVNLASIYREQGKWGYAESILLDVRRNLEKSPDSHGELKAVTEILLGQVSTYRSNSTVSETYLSKAEAFFDPYFKKYGIYAQRLGRIAQLRQFNSFLSRQWSSAHRHGQTANALFEKASGQKFAFDHLDPAFLEISALAIQGQFSLSEANLQRLQTDMTTLPLGNSIWISRVAAMNHVIQTLREPARNKNAIDAIGDLLRSETIKGSYDVQTDVLIRTLYHDHTGENVTAKINETRREAGAPLVDETILKGICE